MTGPSKPTTDDPFRVVRGGTWIYTSAAIVRAASRNYLTPSVRDYYFGFRCAQRGARQPMGKVTP